MLELRIELLSPLCSATGTSGPGAVDREIVFDNRGLPYLPGRRIKGLLRDAYSELEQSGLAPLPKGTLLFGAPGQFAGVVKTGDARLSASASLVPWLRYAISSLGDTIRRKDVMDHYSEIRKQTRIDPFYARAAEDTLRSIRTLRAGLEFRACIGALRSDDEKLALGLAAGALQTMGTSRSRGFGQVRCALLDGDRNLTDEAIERFQSGNAQLVIAEPTKPEEAPQQPPSVQLVADPDHRLRFRLTLEQAALFPVIGGDPFTVFSHEFVPGSVVRGVFATRFLRHGVTDETFYHLFCGGVAFLPANLSLPNRDAPAYPIPHSVRRYKDEDRYVDLAFQDWPDEAMTRIPGWADLEDLYAGRTAHKLHVTMRLEYHHARAADRRIQRAIGVEESASYDLVPVDAGALFTYQSVDAGQSFTGELLGSAEDLHALRGLVASGETVEIGRSRSAQYGGRARWDWLTEGPELITPGGEESGPAVAKIVVTLLTPLVTVNHNGHPVPEFPVAELGTRLGTKAVIEKSFARVEWQGGYLAHQRLPRQQMPALAGGSVFVIKLGEARTARELKIAGRASFGLRVEDGFGRILIQQLEDGEERFVNIDEGSEPRRVKEERVERAGAERPRYHLALALLRSRVKEVAIGKSLAHAKSMSEENLAHVNPHLLARLTRMLEQNELREFAAKLRRIEPGVPRTRDPLRSAAVRQLELARMPEERGKSLGEFLIRRAENWHQTFEEFAAIAFGEPKGWRVIFGDNPLLKEDLASDAFNSAVVKHYLIAFLGALARRQRATKKKERIDA